MNLPLRLFVFWWPKLKIPIEKAMPISVGALYIYALLCNPIDKPEVSFLPTLGLVREGPLCHREELPVWGGWHRFFLRPTPSPEPRAARAEPAAVSRGHGLHNEPPSRQGARLQFRSCLWQRDLAVVWSNSEFCLFSIHHHEQNDTSMSFQFRVHTYMPHVRARSRETALLTNGSFWVNLNYRSETMIAYSAKSFELATQSSYMYIVLVRT